MHPLYEFLDLLQRHTEGDLTEGEQRQFSDYLASDAFNEWLDLDIRMKLQQQYAVTQKINHDKAAQILANILRAGSAAPVIQMPARKRSFSWKYAAAILVILIGSLAYLWNTQDTEPATSKGNTSSLTANDVLPGDNRATLTLADGTTITLDSTTSGRIADQGNTTITKTDEGIIAYRQKGAETTTETTYNTMTTPKGGQYQLQLPDGSKVWLNAASSITYPTAFTQQDRQVSIKGEAYFEVAKDKTKPFIVATKEINVRVLGTHFNVNTYEDEAGTKVSLAEGSVSVAPSPTNATSKQTTLKPGEAYTDGKVTKTDITHDLAWKNGLFAFKKADLPTVMRQLARWYNLEIQYSGNTPQRSFTGEIDRSLTLKQVLNGLSQTRINYELKENKLIIHP